MNISGVLVHVRANLLDNVRDELASLPGVETHTVTDDGRIIITIEEPDDTVGAAFLALQDMQGVLSAALVYQQSEPDDIAQETGHETLEA